MKSVYFFLLLTFILPVVVVAQWDGNTSTKGTAMHTLMSENSIDKLCISDGNNGSIIITSIYDNVISNYKTYAQRIDVNGILNWGTALNPKLVDENLYATSVIPDGAGGAFIAGEKSDGQSNTNTYIQHINSSGNITWIAGGIKVSNSSTGTANLDDGSFGARLCSDGSGGVIISWYRDIYDEDVAAETYLQAFAQRYNASGSALWGTNGVQLSTAVGFRGLTELVTDGAGGAIIFFVDTRNSDYLAGEDYEFPNLDIYAQRISAAGTRMWTDAGVGVCTEPNIQFIEAYGGSYYAVSDGAGGGIIVFEDFRNGNDNASNIYAQKVNGLGVKQWTASGVVVCNSANDQEVRNVVSNGDQGIVILWYDERSINSGSTRLYTQQINSAGSTLWTVNGVLVNGTAERVNKSDVTPDGNGNYVYSWDSYTAIKAQRLNNNGTKLWATAGVDICTASSVSNPNLVMSNNGAAIITYTYEGLYAPGASTKPLGVYAKKVETYGVLPLILSEFTAVAQQTKVMLKWSTASEQNTRHFEVERSADNLNFIQVGTVSAAGYSSSGRVYTFTDVSPLKGNNYYRLKLVDKDEEFNYSPVRMVNFTKADQFVLLSNPVKSGAIIKYTSPTKTIVRVRVIDQLGKLVLIKEVTVEAGTNQISLATNNLSKGIYEIELTTSAGKGNIKMLKQ